MKLIDEYKEIYISIYDARGIIRELIVRDLRVRYRQSLLGYAWALIIPLFIILFFSFLADKRVLSMGDPPFSYPAYCAWNLIVWQLFASILLACTNSLKDAGALVTKVNFSKEALVIASVGQPVIDFIIKLLIVSLVFIWADVVPNPNAALVFLPILIIIVLAVAIGFITSILNLLFRDMSNLVGIIVTYGMFATPVIYAPPTTFPFSLINFLNPVSPLLIATQDLIAFGNIRQGIIFWFMCLVSTLFFFISIRIFHRVIPQAIERA